MLLSFHYHYGIALLLTGNVVKEQEYLTEAEEEAEAGVLLVSLFLFDWKSVLFVFY